MQIAAVFLPLLGAAIAGILAFVTPEAKESRRRIDRLAQAASCGSLLLAAVAAAFVFVEIGRAHV